MRTTETTGMVIIRSFEYPRSDRHWCDYSRLFGLWHLDNDCRKFCQASDKCPLAPGRLYTAHIFIVFFSLHFASVVWNSSVCLTEKGHESVWTSLFFVFPLLRLSLIWETVFGTGQQTQTLNYWIQDVATVEVRKTRQLMKYCSDENKDTEFGNKVRVSGWRPTDALFSYLQLQCSPLSTWWQYDSSPETFHWIHFLCSPANVSSSLGCFVSVFVF